MSVLFALQQHAGYAGSTMLCFRPGRSGQQHRKSYASAQHWCTDAGSFLAAVISRQQLPLQLGWGPGGVLLQQRLCSACAAPSPALQLRLLRQLVLLLAAWVYGGCC